MSNFLGLHHASFLVRDTARSLRFYLGVLGMEQATRVELPFPGAWLSVGEQQIHLLELSNPDPLTSRPQHGGRDRHVAIHVRDLDQLVDSLTEANIEFTMSKSGRRALFCRDPDGNTLELIEAAE
jgi:glyoxylase I family protein